MVQPTGIDTGDMPAGISSGNGSSLSSILLCNGATDRDRTCDLILRRDALFQLSYGCIYLHPFWRINTFFLFLQCFSFTNLLYPLTGSFELFLELSELFFCERFWTMCSGRETSFVHGQGDYRDYFLMASLNVKFTFLEKQHEKWAGVFLYRGGDSNSLYRRGRALSLGQTNYCLSRRPEPYQ